MEAIVKLKHFEKEIDPDDIGRSKKVIFKRVEGKIIV